MDQVDALERMDTQRLLLEAVRTLEEPVRTTVVRRYFEGLSSAEIARASGVPAGTVRARLKRGLDQLRERLDREHGSRSSWMAVIAPLVPRCPTPLAASNGTLVVSIIAQGTLLMSLFKICLTGALAVVLVIGGWKLTHPDVERSVVPIQRAETPVQSDPVYGEHVESALRNVRSRVSSEMTSDVNVPASATAELAPGLPEGSLDARIVDEQGSPLPEAEVLVLRSTGQRGNPHVLAQGRADEGGFATVAVELPRFAVPQKGGAAAASFEFIAQYPGRATHRQAVVVHESKVTHLGDVVLGPGVQVSGLVVDQRGVAMVGARVGASPAGAFDSLGPDDLDRIARVGSDQFDFLTAVQSRADGGFDLVGLSSGPMRLWAHVPGKRFGLSEPFDPHPAHPPVNIEIVVGDFNRGDRVGGQVVGPDGVGRRARLGRMVRAGERSTGDSLSTDAEGLFSFEVEYLDAVYDLSATDLLGEFARVQVRDVRPGEQEVVIRFRRGEPMLIHLRDQDGAPVLDAKISIGIDGRYRRTVAESPEPGDYAFERPTGQFTLKAQAPGFRELSAGRFEDATAPAELNLVMERALVVRGVVRADGAPVANAIVEAFKYDTSASMTVNGLRCPISYFESGNARTDAEGRFELNADLDGSFVVRARHPDWVDAELGPLPADTASEPVDLELSHGGTIEGIVLVAADTSASGIVVAVHRGDGRPRSMRTAEDGSFRFENLMAGQWRVFSLEEDIDPHGGFFSSYQGDEPLEWDCRVQLGRATKFDLDLTAR
tara:strand:- start:424 stop:2748 length:2325 start_codon:yes stop_codon:yes gene_type:complete